MLGSLSFAFSSSVEAVVTATKAVAPTSTIVTATIYHAVPEQTNSDPSHTASMKKIDLSNPAKHRIIAVSRDLEKLGFALGSTVTISNAGKMNGIWYIEDRMNKRWVKRIDFLVNTSTKGGKWHNVKVTLVTAVK